MTPRHSKLAVRLLFIGLTGAAFGTTYGALSSRSPAGEYRWSNPGYDSQAAALTPERVRERVSSVQDREVGVSIADLGLIYEANVAEEGVAHVVMTLTVPTCPFGSSMVQDVREALLSDPAVREVRLRVTFDPPWSWDRVAPEVRERLLRRVPVQTGEPVGARR